MRYDDVVVRLHRRLKFDDARELIAPLALRMSACWTHRCATVVDLVVPVPADPLRWQPRRALPRRLARWIARELDLPMVRALRKHRATRPQTRLTRAARERALRNAFGASTALVQGRSVLLVDDVVTTGATLLACSEALYRAGASRVWGLALARTPFAHPEGAV
jgi:predicted amidophosphoribosyltransferase